MFIWMRIKCCVFVVRFILHLGSIEHSVSQNSYESLVLKKKNKQHLEIIQRLVFFNRIMLEQ